MQLNLAHLCKLLPKLILLTKMQKKKNQNSSFYVKLLARNWNTSAKTPKLLSWLHSSWLNDAPPVSHHPWCSVWSSLMAVTGNVISLSLQQRKCAGGSRAPASPGLHGSTPKSKQLIPSGFEYSLSPPNSQKDISLESFQPSLQIPKFSEFLKRLSVA